ncbi:response regulator transcription factor [Pseudorhodoferax sp. Leaf267]|uniref:response regulator transcription factor n=1 Tax=Pseudorhodoferax sp. Leaf267 TaxID=1736316 RepID=UPI0006FB066B|nr:response regulator [Pseudorhodoferax sp. Leaf267]KQP13193.1 two-component system response regulator [Pseudorhodoferax sp. Leaf267]
MRKILIVEDHADIRKLLRLTLEFEDYDIREAGDGDSGFALALAFCPDVVLLDVMMPGTLSGLDVCRGIKSTASLGRTKVVMLTARGQSGDREAGIQAGADEYLVKPFSTLQVLETLRRSEVAA